MTTPAYEKVKQLTKLSLVSKFDVKEMEMASYIPFCINNGTVYVVTTKSVLAPSTLKNIEVVTGNSNIAVKSIVPEDFSALLDYVKSNLHIESVVVGADASMMSASKEISSSSSDIALKYEEDDDEVEYDTSSSDSETLGEAPSGNPDDKYFNKKIGEILVQMGFATKDQIFNALIEARSSRVPLGTVLVQQSIVSLENLKKALTAQQGYEAVSQEQLKITDAVLSMLPEDFIRVNRVLPISYDDKVLVVGMVNPNDKKVINDIIFLTGLKPSILIITHYSMIF